MMSMFGLVAVTGVVVNDSVIMVDFINRARAVHAGVGRMARQAGGGPTDRRAFESAGLALAVREAGVHRFRPILLTSLTTFFGLAPLMWNQSFDAAFMVPMAVSLGFGVLFATFITLILVPTSYMILDDIGRTLRRLFGPREPVGAGRGRQGGKHRPRRNGLDLSPREVHRRERSRVTIRQVTFRHVLFEWLLSYSRWMAGSLP